MDVDYLIVGQGLAGSLLAWELLQRNARVMVVDTAIENASKVAAGIINPITGLRFVKTPDVDTLLPAALKYYQHLSEFFNQPFYCRKQLVRLFWTPSEQDQCRKRLSLADYSSYMGSIHPEDAWFAVFKSPFGYVEQRQTGHLLNIPLLNSLKSFFIERGCYRQGQINYASIEITGSINWQNISAKQIIFCEGYHGKQNPWFSWLPFQLAKGEILTLEQHSALPDAIINYGHWLLPMENDKFRLGATFDTENLDVLPTLQGKTALLANLKTVNAELANAPIIEHQANIRPCTLDKQPFIGRHLEQANVLIFNGFGAKGSLMIPWHCQRFTDYLLNQTPLPPTCDIQRYIPAYFPTRIAS